MSNSELTSVPETSGVPAPHAPAPTNIPTVTRRNRKPLQPHGNVPELAPSYTKSNGISSLLSELDAYKASMSLNHELSTYIPSFLALKGAIFLATQRLANHDRLLKDTGRTHPYIDEAYIGFIFIYHIMRCNRETLSFVPGFSGFLRELEERYPAHRMHVPGYAVPFIMSITAIQSPFEWQGNIAPALPDLILTTGQHYFRYLHGIAAIFPSPVLMIDQIHDLVNNPRTTATMTPHGLFTRIFGEAVSYAADTRWLSTSVHYALTGGNSTRGDLQFFGVYARSATPIAADPVNNVPGTRNNFRTDLLDLPKDYIRDAAHNTPMTWAQAMGIQDYVHIADARPRYLNWPLQYSAEMAFQCQYIHGSRPLADISTSGLGACSMIMHYEPSPLPDANLDPNTAARLNARRITGLQAEGRTFDHEMEQIAVQHAAISHTNISFPVGIAPFNVHLRTGPVWNHEVTSTSPSIDAAGYLYTTVPSIISSTKV